MCFFCVSLLFFLFHSVSHNLIYSKKEEEKNIHLLIHSKNLFTENMYKHRINQYADTKKKKNTQKNAFDGTHSLAHYKSNANARMEEVLRDYVKISLSKKAFKVLLFLVCVSVSCLGFKV